MRWALTAVLVGACYSPTVQPGAPCSPSGECPSGLVCEADRCVLPGGGDVDANTGGDAETDGMSACTASCQGSTLVCGTTSEPCSHGCSTTGTPHCLTYAPANGVAFSAADGTDVFSINGTMVIDVDTGTIVDGDNGQIIRAAGPGVISGIAYSVSGNYAVFGMAGLSGNMNANLRLAGNRPTIFVVDGDVSWRGILDLGGGCLNGTLQCGGPGGGDGGAGTSAATGCGPGGLGGPGADSTAHAFGGGGGGFGQAGAQGTNTTSGGTAGIVCGSATLSPLVGGSGGGKGGKSEGGVGGGGGGALQISASGSLSLTPPGVIDAGGAGGQGDTASIGGGGGGGAGGAILLEAVDVTITGTLAANGAGGGGHNPSGNGQDGQRSDVPALGGGSSGTSTYRGGAGGTGMVAAQQVSTTSHGGGGGGGAGRIRIHGVTRTLLGSTISPPPSEGTPAN